ncbi:FYVE zinc finger-domain-containing protein [Flammula alnicola]|nr:FYVE zinc finger-domain-containing protein [Flammula alnicola]
MSTPSSPPSNAAYVPYQAYKSKRHSHNLSNPNSHLIPNQSPPPTSRRISGTGASITLLQPPRLLLDAGDDANEESVDNEPTFTQTLEVSDGQSASISVRVDPPLSLDSLSFGAPIANIPTTEESAPQFGLASSAGEGSSSMPPHASPVRTTAVATTSQNPQTPASSRLSSIDSTPKKASTFRRLPVKNSRHAQAAAHSRNVSASSLPPRLSDKAPEKRPSEVQSTSATPAASPGPASPRPLEYAPFPPLKFQESISHSSQESTSSAREPPSTNPPVLLKSISTSTSAENEPVVSSKSLRHTLASPRKPAPYRPGFQPRGVYRPLTDEFLALRRSIHEGEGEGGMARVERTKLERRLEKLIELHFPHPSSEVSKEALEKEVRPGIGTSGRENRRASSFFDFQNLRSLNIHDAGNLWRGVVSGSLGDPTKMDIRASEQRITPWQDDSTVTNCPLCSAAFHPLTNRKHHCRLCGQIICSLPIKHPQRKALCSILFVVDAQTREIEEVGEGVDYGVRKRKTSTVAGQQGRQEEEDKFLKGVRICRECRLILLRQQYYQQARSIPPFAKLYENFISLETDIEESLPKFQELLLSLDHHDQPTKEASAARKRLLESFAQYDKLSKKIRALPCPNGAGSSQDRVQAAIMTRANLFLQKNMFPLQSLPTLQPGTKVSGSSKTNGTGGADESNISVDIDAALAHTLQPLLEQESLLESFVEEAQAQRKFEDVKTLKVNLAEIRQEIERILNGKKV